MGCSASKRDTLQSKPSEEHCSSSSSHFVSHFLSSPVPRALSLPSPLIHHPSLRKGDSNHLVCLTSTTYGSLLVMDQKNPNLSAQDSRGDDDSLSADSVINTWELMDGLDDFSFDSGESSAKIIDSSVSDSSFEFPKKLSSCRYMDCDESVKKVLDSFELVVKEDSKSKSKPLWKHLSEESLLAKLDPNVVSSYRRALSSRQLGCNKPEAVKLIVSMPVSSARCDSWFYLSGADDRIVLYVTTLRGIRKTYEDCCVVRMIFSGFRVPVDERDISMDSAYRKELQNALRGKVVGLPQVFIRGKYIGGAEEIKQLNEVGQLAKLLEGFPVRDPWSVCDSCGDARFVPCPNCSGSRKVFEEENGQLQRCPDCNENGLIRCPGCCS